MSGKEEYISRAERYLRHDLDEAGRRQFEADMKEDAELKDIYQKCKFAMDVINNQVESDLREKFGHWKKERSQATRRTLYWYSAIAASILLLISFYFILTSPQQKSGAQLAHELYSLPKGPGSVMGDADIHWSKGAEAYNRGDFKEAAAEWAYIDNPGPETTYYLAHSYFNSSQYAKASAAFDKLSTGTSVYNYPADWFLALSLLAEEKEELSRAQLGKMISDQRHPYYEDALKLRSLLE